VVRCVHFEVVPILIRTCASQNTGARILLEPRRSVELSGAGLVKDGSDELSRVGEWPRMECVSVLGDEEFGSGCGRGLGGVFVKGNEGGGAWRGWDSAGNAGGVVAGGFFVRYGDRIGVVVGRRRGDGGVTVCVGGEGLWGFLSGGRHE